VLAGIDRGSPLPAWAQVAQNIRRQIETGRLAGGDRLPSETELSEAFDLSRLTVRQALGQLASEGLIERRQGVGTFVAPRKVIVQHDLSLSSSWRDRFHDEGHQSRSILLSALPDQSLPSELALMLKPTDRVGTMTYLKRLHFVDAQPIGMTESWVPTLAAIGLSEVPLDDGSLSTTLRNRYGLVATTVDSTLETMLASAAEALLLDTVADVPIFVVSAISRQRTGDLLDISRTLWVGGRVRFRFFQHADMASAQK